MDGGQEGSTRDASAGIGAPYATDESWHQSPVPGSMRRKADGLWVLLSGHQAVTHRTVGDRSSSAFSSPRAPCFGQPCDAGRGRACREPGNPAGRSPVLSDIPHGLTVSIEHRRGTAGQRIKEGKTATHWTIASAICCAGSFCRTKILLPLRVKRDPAYIELRLTHLRHEPPAARAGG